MSFRMYSIYMETNTVDIFVNPICSFAHLTLSVKVAGQITNCNIAAIADCISR